MILMYSLQALAVPMVRRHARTAEGEHHYGPSVGVVSGNYVTGRRRGIVDGTDFGATGSGVPLPVKTLAETSWLFLVYRCKALMARCPLDSL